MSSENPMYMTLGNYNSWGTKSMNTIHPPIPNGTPSMAVMSIPVYSMPGYETLTHNGMVNGSGYFSIGGAYANFPRSCDRFANRSCAGFL